MKSLKVVLLVCAALSLTGCPESSKDDPDARLATVIASYPTARIFRSKAASGSFIVLVGDKLITVHAGSTSLSTSTTYELVK